MGLDEPLRAIHGQLRLSQFRLVHVRVQAAAADMAVLLVEDLSHRQVVDSLRQVVDPRSCRSGSPPTRSRSPSPPHSPLGTSGVLG